MMITTTKVATTMMMTTIIAQKVHYNPPLHLLHWGDISCILESAMEWWTMIIIMIKYKSSSWSLSSSFCPGKFCLHRMWYDCICSLHNFFYQYLFELYFVLSNTREDHWSYIPIYDNISLPIYICRCIQAWCPILLPAAVTWWPLAPRACPNPTQSRRAVHCCEVQVPCIHFRIVPIAILHRPTGGHCKG